DFHLVCPVFLIRLEEGVAKELKLLQFFPCRIDVASMRGAQSPRKMDVRLGPSIPSARKCIWWYGERRSFRPAMAFHSVSRRHGSSGIEPVKILGILRQRRRRFVDHLFRGVILASLEVSIDQKVSC